MNRRGTKRLLPQDALLRAVAESHSVAGVLHALELPAGGAGRALVQRSIATYGISTAHFVGQGHQCGRPSPHRKSAEMILRKLEPGASRTKTSLLRRALEESAVPRVCDGCGTGDTWQGRRLVLEIDHINGDRWDNRLQNLRYLCPNCHALTDTWCRSGKKRGSATT
ncbi:HNH endonuclease signature motif containing protein [Streptomyces sp. LZ34]